MNKEPNEKKTRISNGSANKIQKAYMSLLETIRSKKLPNTTLNNLFSLSKAPKVNLELYEDVQNLVKQIMSNRVINDHFSDQYVSDLLREITLRLLNGHANDSNREIVTIISKLNTFSIERAVPLVVTGFKGSNTRLSIGLVTFQKFTRRNLMRQFSGYSAERRKEISMLKFANSLIDTTCAVYKHVGDPAKARDSAIYYSSATLSYLQFSVPMIYGWKPRLSLGMAGLDRSPTFQELHVFAPKKPEYTFQSVRLGPELDFELGPAAIKALRKRCGLTEIRKILKKSESERTNFEEAILRSISWFADGERELFPEKKVLHYFIALEGLFSKKSNVKQSIAHGVAWSYGKTAEKRNHIFNKIFDLYELRCDVAHGRKMKRTEKSDITLLRVIAWSAIFSCLKKHASFSSTQELQQWVDAKLLG